MDLEALLDRVLVELEKSTDPERLTLLHRIREGIQTPQDASDVTDMIESLIGRADNPVRSN